MAMAMMEMLAQMEVESDILNPLFLRVAAELVKNIPAQRRTARADAKAAKLSCGFFLLSCARCPYLS